MNKKAKDRRIEKTRTVLHNALISLIKKKDYRSITIQEIIDEANVGRSTFYTHFEDKDDLLLSGMRDLRGMLEASKVRTEVVSPKSYESVIAFSPAMFEHAYEYREVYRALVRSQAGGLVLQYIPAMLVGLIGDEARSKFQRLGRKRPSIPLDLFVHFVASAFVSVMSWWLDSDEPASPAEINACFRALILPTLDSFIDNPPDEG